MKPLRYIPLPSRQNHSHVGRLRCVQWQHLAMSFMHSKKRVSATTLAHGTLNVTCLGDHPLSLWQISDTGSPQSKSICYCWLLFVRTPTSGPPSVSKTRERSKKTAKTFLLSWNVFCVLCEASHLVLRISVAHILPVPREEQCINHKKPNVFCLHTLASIYPHNSEDPWVCSSLGHLFPAPFSPWLQDRLNTCLPPGRWYQTHVPALFENTKENLFANRSKMFKECICDVNSPMAFLFL